ncbi:MAG: hypothetical protein ACREPR_10205 [Brasilonema sp.]
MTTVFKCSGLDETLSVIRLQFPPQVANVNLNFSKIDINQFITEILPSLQNMPEAVEG